LKILYHSAHINYHIDNITRLNLTLREYVTLRNRDLYELSPSLKLKKNCCVRNNKMYHCSKLKENVSGY